MNEESEKKKHSKLWIIGTDGKASITATFATVAFLSTTGAYIASIFEKIGPLTTRPFDSAACSAYLIPILTLYLGRKITDAKFSSPNGKTTTT